MYIKVLKTWTGMGRQFFKGLDYEVDEDVLKKIGNKKLGDRRLQCEIVPAPWDAQKDETAVQVAELQGASAKAAVELERLEDELLNMQACLAGSTSAAADQAEDDHMKAEQCLRELCAPAAAAAANAGRKPTEANKKTASELAVKEADAARAEKEKRQLVVKAQGQLLVFQGDIGLTELEVVDARAELAAMRTDLYELRPDLKPKDESGEAGNWKPEDSEAPDGAPDGKDAADAKGQTDAAGQAAAVQN